MLTANILKFRGKKDLNIGSLIVKTNAKDWQTPLQAVEVLTPKHLRPKTTLIKIDL